MKATRLDCFKTFSDVLTLASAARCRLVLVLLGSAAAATAAPLNYTIQAGGTIDTVVVQPNIDDRDPGETSLRTTTFTRPAFLNYSGATETVTMSFLAPSGFKFVVNPQADSRLSFQVAYTTFSTGGASGGITRVSSSVSFLNPEGSTPVLSDFSTLSNNPHAYQSVSVGTDILTTPFSFTGLSYTFFITGTAANVSVPYFEGGNLTVQMTGLAAGGPALLAVTATAIPEPASATAAAALAVGALIALRRSRRLRV